jgi:hypothetical protein
MKLIKQIYQATQNQMLIEPFTTEDMKAWINLNGIINARNGQKFTDSYINALLSDSDVSNISKNKNQSVLESNVNLIGKKEYRFVNPPR